ncbi:MAG: hypothetical protein HY822_25300, partial [Acidobacteria bacterium]|nr:hypothetical protein [Acidobacteriota bacterium]
MGAARPAGGLLLTAAALWAQSGVPPLDLRPDWRRIGSSAVEMSLAALATGPVERVWYAPDGAALLIRTSSGKTFESRDFESWTASGDGLVPPPLPEAPALRKPEPAALVRAHPGHPARLYALGRSVYRSEDAGRSWANLTAWRQDSILGDGMHDLAVSPRNPDEIAVANDFGVWRSVDGGASWSGLNDALPNLPVRRLLSLPRGMNGARVMLDRAGVETEIEWTPGERVAWKPNAGGERDARRKRDLSEALRTKVTAWAEVSPYLYAGAADGRIWVSADEGRTWLDPRAGSGAAVEALWVDPGDARRALAALAAGDGPRLLRTVNGGLFWDDISANLPNAPLHGVAADRVSGAVYAAGDRGLFFALAELRAAGPAPRWVPVGGSLPAAAVKDVRLDEEGNQIYVALEGQGVFAATAPHRQLDPRVVSAADYTARPAAAGARRRVQGGRGAWGRAGG